MTEPLVADKSTNGSGAGRPIVIAHRGASGERPEHTLEAYELALAQGADFIELDLVATRDGVLIARHENALAVVARNDEGTILRDEAGQPEVLEATTNVADRPEFAERLTVKAIDGRPVAGWFSEDFTLEEIRSLRARERMAGLRPQNQLYDDRFAIPTLEEAITLLRAFEARTGDVRGVYIELKHPTYFEHVGRRLDGALIDTDLPRLLVDRLQALDFTDGERIYLQCFEVAPLLTLKALQEARGLSLPLIQLFGDVQNRRFRAGPYDMRYHAAHGGGDHYGVLVDLLPAGLTADLSYAELATPAVLKHLADAYAAGIGPPRHSVLKVEPVPGARAVRYLGAPEPFLTAALDAGLLVHPYTLRAEAPFLFRQGEGTLTAAEEALVLLRAGVQGFFIDHPSEGRLAVSRFLAASDVPANPAPAPSVAP
ncbi:MAG: glycerophosphodiester phosphodiesterase family protein [Pseudomonadota bacterium]